VTHRSICCDRLPELIEVEDMVALFCGNRECETFVFQFLPDVDLDELESWWDMKCGRIDGNNTVSLARMIKRSRLPKRLHHVFEQQNCYTLNDIKNLKPSVARRRFGLTLKETAQLFGAARKAQ